MALARLPRYVESRRLKSGATAFYWKPRHAERGRKGCPQAEALGTDLGKAITRAGQLNELLDGWRAGNLKDMPPADAGTLGWLFRKYQASAAFRGRADKTREQYRWHLGLLERTTLASGRILATVPIAALRRRHARKVHEALQARGPVLADHVMRTARLAWNWAVDELEEQLGEVPDNPFARLGQNRRHERRSPLRLWKAAEVARFVKAADDAGRPSMALAALLCFDLCQRPGDARTLPRAAWHRRNRTLTVIQAKTGSRVVVPLHDLHELEARLRQVDPAAETLVVNENTGRPYAARNFAATFADIREAAKLDGELWLQRMRHSGLTELGDAGATDAEIMAVSGHATREIVSVYTQASVAQARSALRKRARARAAGGRPPKPSKRTRSASRGKPAPAPR